MVHSGYEASAVNDTFGSVRGFLATVRAVLFGGRYKDVEARGALEQPVGGPLVQISVKGAPADRERRRVTVEV
jgi:hypothetical protein